MLSYALLIAVLPLLSFICIVFFFNKNNKLSSYFSIGMVLTSFLLSCIVLIQVLNDPTPKEYWINWAVFGDTGIAGAKTPTANSAITAEQNDPGNDAVSAQPQAPGESEQGGEHHLTFDSHHAHGGYDCGLTRSDIFIGLYARRPTLCQILRLLISFYFLDAGLGIGRDLYSHVRILGIGRFDIIFINRILV